FMVVTNIGSAIGTEATLSFLGIGLPVEIISWGSMLSNADQALLSNYWWIILTPGLFLVVTLVCITDIGNFIRKRNNKGISRI
ncbi:MAG: ABC transporter permease, partial [Eubacterium sp.]